jgi:hypothetical protein
MPGSGQSPPPAPIEAFLGRSDSAGPGATAPPILAQPAARLYLPMLIVFLATRIALHAAGLRMNLDLRWMFLSDPADLTDRLLETIFYFHAFAPGTNLLTGLLLKLDPQHLVGWATGIFWASGFLLVVSLFRVLEELGVSRRAALCIAFAFSLVPQSLYLENLYLYTYPCAALLCLAAWLFHRALLRATVGAWSALFFTGSVLGWLYTTFHLFWLGAMVLAGSALAARGTRGRVLIGAAVPFMLLFALYAKNYAVFGVFGATSWGGGNLTLTTTKRMPEQLRSEWIQEGKLSPFAAISVFAPPADYLKFFPAGQQYPWPGSNALTKPSLGAPNYNHGLFLDVNRQRRADAAYYIKAQPLEYLKTVLGHNLPELFSSTTHWHPNDKKAGSPHAEHRRVLGHYERAYDRIVYGFPLAPVGLYIFLPPCLLWAVIHAWRGLREQDEQRRARAALLAFCTFQVLFVVGISCIATAQESARYRYAVEPCIWALVAAALHAAWPRLRERLTV